MARSGRGYISHPFRTKLIGGGVDATVTPSTVAVVVAVPAPTLQTSQTVTPAVVAVVVALPAPTIKTGSTVTPAVVAVVTALPAPTIQAAMSPTPAAVAVVVALPAPTIKTGSTVTPATIAVTVGMGASSPVVGSTTVLVATIAVAIGLPTPNTNPNYVFSGGTGVAVVPRVLPETRGLPYKLMRHYRNGARMRTLIKLDGVYMEVDEPLQTPTLDDATEVYLGGHSYEVSSAIADELTALGYVLTPVPAT